ncbi:MAG: SLC5 family protein [Phycisphaerae bacterium]
MLASTSMKGLESFQLGGWDYLAFIAYFAILSTIGYWAGRRKKSRSDDYFLAGRSLPWYVVGSSFIASNISSEHFIGMVGAAFTLGICAALFEWGNILSFSILIWFFIPFLLASKVFTAPEFMERRFNPTLRQVFAVVTVITNVLAFLAGVLYGGGVAIQKLFGWDLWFAVTILAIAAGTWAIYGGLSSAAWADVFTVIVMVTGGLTVTILGLQSLSPERSIVDGFKTVIERNQATEGIWAEAVAQNVQNIVPGEETYNRLSVIQPATHKLIPWSSLILITFTVSIWYNVINQFMIQRVLGAKSMYHARMGIVFAGYMKILLPVIVVLPGLILFAKNPEILKLPWDKIGPEADKGYVHMLQELVPLGIRGLFLAALFGAIQSTVQAVLNSTATIFTLDIYKPMLRPTASEKNLVWTGRIAAAAFLAFAILLALLIAQLGGGLFNYVQTLYAFFAPPFGAVFLLGILFRRINGQGASAGVLLGFLTAIAIKLALYKEWLHGPLANWLSPFGNQAVVSWLVAVAACVIVSLATRAPQPEQVTDDLTFNWRKLNIFADLGRRWYTHVLGWWALFVIIVGGLMLLFSGIWF